MEIYKFFFFFFQAEDGIRDFHVTGVQTCALPISIEAVSLSVAKATVAAEVKEASGNGRAAVDAIAVAPEHVAADASSANSEQARVRPARTGASGATRSRR